MTASVMDAQDLRVQTWCYDQPSIGLWPIILRKLQPHRLFGGARLLVPLASVEKRVSCQRDQHAKDDHPDFTEEGTPTMQRLRHVDANACLRQLRKRNRRGKVRNGSKGDTHQWRRSGGRDGDNGEGFSVGKVDLVANLGPEHRPDQGGGEADACVDRIALVVADDLDGPGLAVALVG